MSVSRAEIERIARLALVTPSSEEMDRLVHDIHAILDFVGQLSAVHTEKSAASYRVGPDAAPLRPDVIEPIPLSRQIADIAPNFREGFFVVPRLEGVGDE